MPTKIYTLEKFDGSTLKIFPENYCGTHGWYWGKSVVASFIADAVKRKAGNFGKESLECLEIYVADVLKTPAGQDARGCHDTSYSMTVRVCSTWVKDLPTAEEVYDCYKDKNAHFKIERIHGGYHFYTVW